MACTSSTPCLPKQRRHHHSHPHETRCLRIHPCVGHYRSQHDTRQIGSLMCALHVPTAYVDSLPPRERERGSTRVATVVEPELLEDVVTHRSGTHACRTCTVLVVSHMPEQDGVLTVLPGHALLRVSLGNAKGSPRPPQRPHGHTHFYGMD